MARFLNGIIICEVGDNMAKKGKVFCGYCKYNGINYFPHQCLHPKNSTDSFDFPDDDHLRCADLNEKNDCKLFAMEETLTDEIKKVIQKLKGTR